MKSFIWFVAVASLVIPLPVAASDPVTVTAFTGVVKRPANSSQTFDVYLYTGDSSDAATFYGTRKLITSTQTDADGRYVLVATNLPRQALTIRAKNSADRIGGDVVERPGPQGWPSLTSDVDIAVSPQTDTRFGITSNNYAAKTMLFVTDRATDGVTFQNTTASNEMPSFGSFVGHVALGAGQAIPPHCGLALDWDCSAPPLRQDDSYVDKISIAASGDSAHVALRNALATIPGNTLLVFVHGYNNSFESGASLAARLSYLMEPAPHATLYYSWPSQHTIHGYMQDHNNADRSAKQNLPWVLDELAALPSHPQIILVAHSMGSYAITTALSNWAAQHPTASGTFDQLNLFAADLDVSLWNLTYEPGVDRIVKKIRFYSNANDLALKTSQCTTGDYTNRVGQVVSWPPPPTNLTVFDATPVASTADFGHGYVGSSLSVAMDWHNEAGAAPVDDLKETVSKLAWLHDGGGGPINWDAIATNVLCGIWKKLP